MEYLFESLALLFLLFLSAFFSGSETGIFHLQKVSIEKLVVHRPSFSILREREKLLGTILFGNTLVNAGASILAARIFYRIFHNIGPSGLAIVTGIMTYIILVFGEFVPKLYSLRNSEKVSLKSLLPLQIARYIFLPITIPINALISLISPSYKGVVGKDELRMLVTTEAEDGKLTPMEKEFIFKLLNFKDKQIGDIMTPLPQLESIPLSIKLNPIKISKLSHSRIPVYNGSINRIAGILYLKDLLNQQNPVKVKKLIRKPYFVSISMSTSALLSEFQARRPHIAVVVDENKATKGIITLDDILNTIIGRK